VAGGDLDVAEVDAGVETGSVGEDVCLLGDEHPQPVQRGLVESVQWDAAEVDAAGVWGRISAGQEGRGQVGRPVGSSAGVEYQGYALRSSPVVGLAGVSMPPQGRPWPRLAAVDTLSIERPGPPTASGPGLRWRAW
jgi:hypothetical protein